MIYPIDDIRNSSKLARCCVNYVEIKVHYILVKSVTNKYAIGVS